MFILQWETGLMLVKVFLSVTRLCLDRSLLLVSSNHTKIIIVTDMVSQKHPQLKLGQERGLLQIVQ